MAELTLLLRRAKRNNESKIDLSNKDISFIPNDVYSLSKVEILDLSSNRITALDQKISDLKSLKVLDLSNNQLMDLPKQILQLKNLQALILDGNPMIKQFEPLLDKKASFDIQKSLRRVFGLQGRQEKQQNKAPSWFQEAGDHGNMNSSKAFGKMVELENQFKQQQSKVQLLEKQLQKMTLKEQKSSKQSFELETQPILEILFKDLKIGDQISMGGFSTIHKGEYKGLKVAVKKIFNPKINEELLRQFSNQINVLAKMRHPNIVLLIGICSIPPNLCIVLEYIESGSLYDLIHKRKTKLKAQQRKKIVSQMISAVHYLHEHEIVHRDIKSHNFLIDENYTVKLCDFGLAKNKNELNKGPMQFSGTPVYMSQQLFSKKSYDQSIDIFALGTLIYEVYCGQIPYNGLDPADIKERLMKDCRLPNKGDITKQILDIVNRCRNPDADFRPSTEELLNFDGW